MAGVRTYKTNVATGAVTFTRDDGTALELTMVEVNMLAVMHITWVNRLSATLLGSDAIPIPLPYVASPVERA